VRQGVSSTGQLLPPSDRFLAREDALRAITRSLQRGARFVVVIGPGGMGKTRLLGEYCASPDGARLPAVFVDAAPIDDMDGLRGAIASALGSTSTTTDDDGIADALSGRGPVCLLLDNVEDVALALGASASTWLARAPDLVLMATSRVAPTSRGVHLVRLEGLDHEEAAALFVERAAELGVEISSDADLDRVIARLGGIPLAIELAAARTEVMSLRLLADRLEQSLSVLEDQRRDRPERHFSLEVAFQGSVAALSDAARSTLLQCAVFASRFDLRAAEDVVSTDGDVSSELSELTSRSLLSRTPNGERTQCIRMLEPLRRLLPVPDTEVRGRHATHFIDRGHELAMKTDGVLAPVALDELVEIREDLLAAVRFAWQHGRETDAARGTLALSRVDRFRRSSDIAVRHFEGISTHLDAVAPRVRCELLVEEATVRRCTGDAEGALAALERIVDDDSESSPELFVRASAMRGLVQALAGKLDEAAVTLEDTARRAREIGDDEGAGLALAHLGRISRVTYRLDEAERCFRAALDSLRSPSRGRLYALVGLCNARAERGDHQGAIEGYERMLTVATELGDDAARGCALGNLAVLAHAEGRVADALDHYEASLELLHRLGDRVILPIYVSSRALLLAELGRSKEALEDAELGSRLARLGSRDQILGLATEGALRGAAGATHRGDELLAEAETGADEIDDANLVDTVALLRTIWRLAVNHPDGLREAHGTHWEATNGPLRGVRHRLAARHLAHWLEMRGERQRCEDAPRGALILDEECRSFVLPGHEEPMPLGPDGPVGRLLVALVRERRRRPGAHLSSNELIARVWPGELIVASAAKNRLHVALSGLRKAGLRPILERSEAGYRLSPEVPVLITRAGAWAQDQ
jgi:predicted ATPase